MKVGALKRWSFVVAGVLAAGLTGLWQGPARATVAMSFTPGTDFIDQFDRVIGWTFRTGADPLQVTALGVFDAGDDGLVDAHAVGIFRRGEPALLVSATVQAGTASGLTDHFRYESASLVLAANTDYVIAAAWGGNTTGNPGDRWQWSPLFSGVGGPVVFDTHLDLVPGLGGAFAISSTLVAPTGNLTDARTMLIGPNFQFSTGIVSAPAPAGVGLFVLGLAALGVLRRRKTA